MKTRITFAITSAAIGAVAAIAVISPTAAQAATSSTHGLFGVQDPTYDGVYRQATALLGLKAVGARAPQSTITWLARQQCADGSFTAYRADLSQPCAPSDPVNYVGKDTNSTALAAIALRVHGHKKAARHAQKWLVSKQLPNGGWSWFIGADADTASTGLVMAALRGSKVGGASKAVRAANSWLQSVVIGCNGTRDERFGLPFMPGTDTPGVASFFGSTQGLLGLAGSLPIAPAKQAKDSPRVTCDKQGHVRNSRDAVARWVADELERNGGVIPSLYEPTKPDWNSTSVAVMGLVSSRSGGEMTRLAILQLKTHVNEVISTTGGDSTGAIGGLLLAAHAHGNNPTRFGGVDLVKRLLATIQ